MKWLKNFYKENIYGVIGTLVFHILIVSFLVINGFDKIGKLKDDQVFIELPSIIEEAAAKPEMKEQIGNNETNLSGNNKSNGNNKLTSNRASNLSSTNEDKFFDAQYRKEISEAKKLVSKVDNQLKKEVIDINDVKMPVENTSGMERDSIKNTIYAGESNITYNLGNRYHISLPIPVYLAQGGGTIMVDIIVDQSGNVIKATSRKNNKILDPQVFYYAELAATRTVFNSDRTAPEQQKGTIKYNFIAQ